MDKKRVAFLGTMWLCFLTSLQYLLEVVPKYAHQFAEARLPLSLVAQIAIMKSNLFRQYPFFLWFILLLLLAVNVVAEFYVRDKKRLTIAYAVLTFLILVCLVAADISMRMALI